MRENLKRTMANETNILYVPLKVRVPELSPVAENDRFVFFLF